MAAVKEDRVINMDSQAPNAVVKEALQQGLIWRDIKEIRPEFSYGESRFDFFVQKEGDLKGTFIEVKGVTLETDNIASFPDAPSDRAVKHVDELIKAKKEVLCFSQYCFVFVICKVLAYTTQIVSYRLLHRKQEKLLHNLMS